MRHLKKTKKFHRKHGQRRALFLSLVNNLALTERIKTTEAKAKVVKSGIEKAISLGKKQTLASLRLLIARFPKKAGQKIYYELAPRYEKRKGGYVRIIKSGERRKTDGAKMAIVEFV